MILKKFLNFWKSEPRDSYKKNSYLKKRCVFRSAKKFYTILTQRQKFGIKISRLAQNKKMHELIFAVGSKQKISRELNFADDPKNREIREI